MGKPIDWSKSRPTVGDLDADKFHRLCDALEEWAEDLHWDDIYHGNAGVVLQAMYDLGWDADWLQKQASGFFKPNATVR